MTLALCDACQELPAIVTIGCVDYCARCAPKWRDEDEGDDGDE
jgi:hypothetical protein